MLLYYRLTFPRGHFPRLAECAHFHYETVDFGTVQVRPGPELNTHTFNGEQKLTLVSVSQSRSWLVKRSYEDFRVLDKHLHLCIYDRRFSKLNELPRFDYLKDTVEEITKMLAAYLSHLSAIADNKINCGPVLTWMEIDNKGNRMLVAEESSINVPAIAAAHVIKRYIAQATDELTFEVGDIVSVIDMPPKEDTGWWRGKHGFQVGFFPCDCVELISDRIPTCVSSSVSKPVCKKHGKLVTFLRSFMKSRPPPQKLRQRGILRERVFGCDLGEHLLNSEHDVPQVIKCCTEFIERHGVVDGMYRLSGISSNIQKLRHEFDSEEIPDLSRDVFKQDIHSVGSLCKLYFRELPNPLLTYQLYERFSEAVSAATDEERLVKIHNVIQQLPPPHYRTLEFLMRHLSQLATFSPITNMHTKNLAIVWAPNLLRSKQIESACFSGTAAFMEVRIQSVVVEFIMNNTESLFSRKVNAHNRESTGTSTLSRPKSLLVCSPSTKLLSLEEAQARTQAQLGSPVPTPVLSHSEYIEVGEGPGALMGKFHTVIALPTESKRAPGKLKKSPVGSWRSFFHLGKSSSMTSKRKLKRHPSEPNEIKSIALPGGRGDSGTLRSTKSEESLTSLHNLESKYMYRLPRPHSTSDALSTAFRDDLCDARVKGDHYNNQVKEVHSGADGPAFDPAVEFPPHQEDDLDLCLPAPGMAFLDFDPMSFQCSPVSPPTAKSAPQRKASVNCRKHVRGSSESKPISSSLNKVLMAMSNFTPTVSSLEAGALLPGSTEVRDQREGRDRPLGAVKTVHLQTVSSSYLSGGASPPIQSVCSIQSPLAAAVLANTDSVNAYNYQTVLAEASMPGSVGEIPPHRPMPSLVNQYSADGERAMREAEDVYRHHRVNPAGQVSGPPRPDYFLPHQAGPKSMYKPTSDSCYNTLGLRNYPSNSPQYSGQPQPREEYSSSGHHRSRGQWQRTEDRTLGYPGIRRARSFHAQQPIRIELADTLFYVQRPAVQEKEYKRLLQSDVQPLQPYFENGCVQYRYSPYSDAVPLEESYYYVDPYRTSRIRHSQSYTMRSTKDCGHPGYHYRPSHNIPTAKRELFLESRDPERVIYKSWDHPEGCDRPVYQPIRQENRARQRPQGPIMSPYENLNPPLPQSDIRGRDISHTRSRSDPGNAWLLAIDRVDSQREVPAMSPISPGQQLSDPSDYIRHQRVHWPGEEPVPPRRESVTRRTQPKQGTPQRYQPQHCNVPMLLDVKNVEQGEGGHSRGCDKNTVIMGNAANSYSAQLKPSIPRRPRSQSIKEPRYYHHVKSPVEQDHPGSFSTQPHRRTQSTKAMPSHYNNLEGYYPAPKPKPSGSGKAMPGPFPGHGCMPPHSHRLLSHGLGGHGAFLQTGHRPEAGVYAE
uniref:Rho GTPase activating protein 32a n=1 Tax=Oncorhynchus kisutch TaxID=8019 RepID=A0A8C7M9U7_ONCKI